MPGRLGLISFFLALQLTHSGLAQLGNPPQTAFGTQPGLAGSNTTLPGRNANRNQARTFLKVPNAEDIKRQFNEGAFRRMGPNSGLSAREKAKNEVEAVYRELGLAPPFTRPKTIKSA